MNFSKSIVVAAAFLFAGSASAAFTPTYNGNTVSGTELISGTVSAPTEWGYYIWNEELDPYTWNVRWTGLGLTDALPEWFGGIQFQESSLDGSFDGSSNSANGYQLEFSGTYGDSVDANIDVQFAGGDDFINWTAFTNNTGGVDGFSFTLTSDVEVLQFELGGSMFAGMTGIDEPGNHIFIGEDLETPFVTFTDYNGGTAQQFEVQVSEPTTVALLGLALAGLGFRARKNRKS